MQGLFCQLGTHAGQGRFDHAVHIVVLVLTQTAAEKDLALGIGQGGLVFTVSHTAVATVAAIECAGAAPVLVDVDPVTYTMSPESLAKALALLKTEFAYN